MRHGRAVFWVFAGCVWGGCAWAQTQIGGGTCNSANLMGDYTINLTGREVTGAGAFSAVYFANGTVNFDGQNNVKFTMTGNTASSTGTPLTYLGTYSVQANCQGSVTVTSGDTASFTLVVHSEGNSFYLGGHDATYTITGSGSKQPGDCLLATLTGVYELSGIGYTLSGTAVAGVTDAAGLVEFDGQGDVTVSLNTFTGAAPAVYNAAGSYAVAATCVGTATLTDPSGKSAVMMVSINDAAGTDFQMIFADPKFLISGSGHLAFGI